MEGTKINRPAYWLDLKVWIADQMFKEISMVDNLLVDDPERIKIRYSIKSYAKVLNHMYEMDGDGDGSAIIFNNL